MCVSGVHAVLLHHQEIEVLHVRVVVGEGAVYGGHLADGLVEDEGALAGLVYELVFVFKSVDVAHHLAQPCACYLVLELRAGNLQRL